jgi:HK97 family phage prohead protease
MNNRIEVRTSLSLRADGGQAADPQYLLRGRAVSYNSLSKPLPSQRGLTFRERVMPGAFKRSLASGSDVIATFNHNDQDIPLGRTKSGTLRLSDGPQGLDFAVQLDKNNSEHRNLFSAVSRGDVSQCSFGFVADEDEFDDDDPSVKDDNGNRCSRRSIKSATLHSVDVVTNPAYDATSVTARSAKRFVNTLFQNSTKSFEDQIFERTGYDPSLMRARAYRMAAEIRRDAVLAEIAEKRRAKAVNCSPLTADEVYNLRREVESRAIVMDDLSADCPGNSMTSTKDDHAQAVDAHRCIARRCERAAAESHHTAADAHSAAAENPTSENRTAALVACKRAFKQPRDKKGRFGSDNYVNTFKNGDRLSDGKGA